MKSEEKLVEILLKIYSGTYTNLDELKDLVESLIELTVKNPEMKKEAKAEIALAKEILEKRNNNNLM